MRPFPISTTPPVRYRQFHKALEEDKLGRAQGCRRKLTSS